MSDELQMDVDAPLRELSALPPDGEGGAVFRAFFDRSGVRAARLDHKLRVVEASVDFGLDVGRSAAELHGAELPELLHPSVRAQVVHQLRRLLDGQRSRFVERVLLLRGSTVFGGELVGLTVYDEASRIDGLMVLLRTEQGDRDVVVAGGRPLLSVMHARILEGVAAGASTVQLATMLFLSCGGVEYHLTVLLRTMQVRNRSALVSKAYSTGLFCVGSWPPRVLPEYVDAR